MERAVVKVGGHLISRSPGELDADYARRLVEALREANTITKRLIVVVGGGRIARVYVQASSKLGANMAGRDALGIEVARVNALLLATAYYGFPPYPIPRSYEEAVRLLYSWPLVFVGGFQPGQSTTAVATILAEAARADKLVIATNVDGIYDSDPRVNPNARLLREVTVDELERIMSSIPQTAGEYRLIDAVSLAILKRTPIDAHVVNGSNPQNIVRALKGENVGTRIIWKQT